MPVIGYGYERKELGGWKIQGMKSKGEQERFLGGF
jgi:hypothetical protein